MDVDSQGLYKYDDYVTRPEREVITVETKLKPSNKGFAMLAKLGWVEGQALGVSGDGNYPIFSTRPLNPLVAGRVDPVPFHIKRDSTGLGKMNQDVRMIETTGRYHRKLLPLLLTIAQSPTGETSIPKE
jgi:hypothetical protein